MVCYGISLLTWCENQQLQTVVWSTLKKPCYFYLVFVNNYYTIDGQLNILC